MKAWTTTVSVALAAAVALFAALPSAEEAAEMPEGYIGGLVESSAGAEAGVWVIAETEELETKFAKVVVTDDEGRFVLPEMPDATYDVWVRGYGLVDSEKVRLSPSSDDVHLTAVIAPDEQSAAQYYPGNYWYALIEPPAPDQFPGTGPDGNGISPNLQSQAAWLDIMKQGCQLCHQLGNTATRVVEHRGRLRLDRGGLGPPRPDRAARQPDERGAEPLRAAARARDVRRLVGPDRRGRDPAAAGSAFGHRTESRRHPLGLGRGQLLHPRRDHHRQTQPDRQRRRAGLRRIGGPRHADCRRPGREHRRRAQDPGSSRGSRRGAVAVPAGSAPAVLLLGRPVAVGTRRSRRARELVRPRTTR